MDEAATSQADLRAATAGKIRQNAPYARCFACLGLQFLVD